MYENGFRRPPIGLTIKARMINLFFQLVVQSLLNACLSAIHSWSRTKTTYHSNTGVHVELGTSTLVCTHSNIPNAFSVEVTPIMWSTSIHHNQCFETTCLAYHTRKKKQSLTLAVAATDQAAILEVQTPKASFVYPWSLATCNISKIPCLSDTLKHTD